ncbi:MAG: hypothetical protein Q8Q09_02580 [Deltaproteobacteria bacterium]|nr:hypothetical protein [Deltaproteobacteria bacterium]
MADAKSKVAAKKQAKPEVAAEPKPKAPRKKKGYTYLKKGAVPTEDSPAFITLEHQARTEGDVSDPRRTDRIGGLAPAQFAQRFLRPLRARQDEVIELVDGLTDPEEAWETLASRGVIPMDWLDGDARQVIVPFVKCAECDARVEFLGHASDCSRRAVPASMMAAVAIASDVAGIVAAESLAMTVFERLYGDVAAKRPTLIWRVANPSNMAMLAPSRPGHRQKKAAKPGSWELTRSYEDAMKIRRDFDPTPGYGRVSETMVGVESKAFPGAFNGRYSGFVMAHRAWISALIQDTVNQWSWALSVREKRPNPFEPLCAIWALGYAVESVDEDALVLLAPALRLGPEWEAAT